MSLVHPASEQVVGDRKGVGAGKPLRMQCPKSPLLADLSTLVEKLQTKPESGATEKGQSIFSRISRVLSLS